MNRSGGRISRTPTRPLAPSRGAAPHAVSRRDHSHSSRHGRAGAFRDRGGNFPEAGSGCCQRAHRGVLPDASGPFSFTNGERNPILPSRRERKRAERRGESPRGDRSCPATPRLGIGLSPVGPRGLSRPAGASPRSIPRYRLPPPAGAGRPPVWR